MEFAGHGILLDVEGTTSAVAYVYDVMFPFARRNLSDFLAERWDDPQLDDVKRLFADESGISEFRDWPELRAKATRLMDNDVKATGLKQLQGLIWEAGFRSGELRAHVFDDVPPALAAWRDAGLDLRVYSSGSVHAQKLFFGHTEAGDLLSHLSGHYDTTTGPKRESASYATIADDWGLLPAEVLFLSDVTEELDAAREAGMLTGLVHRPGNADPTTSAPAHPAIGSFDEIVLV